MPFWKDAELEKEEDRQALAGSRGWQRVRHYKVSVLQAAQARLKQVEELETKVAGGLAPSAEQREKLARKAALADELAAVEARL